MLHQLLGSILAFVGINSFIPHWVRPCILQSLALQKRLNRVG